MDEVQRAIHRLKRGEMAGLETLLAHYQVRAVRAAFMIVQDEAAAEDVAQDVFQRIYQRIRQYDENQPFEPYLFRSVVHAALNATRRSKKNLPLDGDLAEVEALLTNTPSPEAQVEANQLSQQILSAISKLSPRQRAVIVQRYYLEMSEKEMSESLQAAPGTVKWLLNAARARLSDLLRPERSNP